MIFEQDQQSFKLTLSVLLFIEVMFFTQVPYFSNKMATNKTVTAIFNSLSIGIFLGIAFFHMIPSANQKLQHIFKHQHDHRQGQHNHIQTHLSDHSHSHGMQLGSLISIIVFFFILIVEIYVHDHHDHQECGHKRKNYQMNILEQKNEERKNKYIDTILIQFALSLHCFFQCMSIGIESNNRAAFTLAIAVMFHKWAQALTLGYSYYQAGMTQRQALKFSLFHSFLNGGAVILGYIISHSNQTMSGVFNAIAGGTFLYVCFIQKISKNFTQKKDLLPRVCLVFIGLVFIMYID